MFKFIKKVIFKILRIKDDRLKINSIKEVFEYDGFKISFAIAIIILGIISLSYETSNTILVGISISSFIFSIIDTFRNRSTLLYMFPLTILLIFCIYPDVFIVKYLSDPKLNNLIIYVSFGISFIASAYSNYLARYRLKKEMHDGLLNSVASTGKEFEKLNVVLKDINKIRRRLNKVGFHDSEVEDIFDNIMEFLLSEYNIGKAKYDLSVIGRNDIKNTFTLDEIEDVIQENSSYEFKKKIEDDNSNK